ncbi:alpha-amylase family protein [Nafulsella turpanensis]|uniref:alpha-amylase family protein n=1 Tax=Nafulsella turpanensis TaxID=1265690 RepID=UPI0003499586|nr:alpha-amylase family protein [Nafulsella turpanensis]
MKYWYKNAVIYCLDVETFMDSNGDGVGDFTGLKNRLQYLAGLGVTCIWILPFYASPNRDNGYDVADYFAIGEAFGNFGGFVEFLEAAEEAGIRVLIDLVVNHTSDQHPWFQESRKSKDSKYRDYYIWSEEKPEEDGKYAIFGKEQGGNWAYDEAADAYYYHTFYQHQPDLNSANPEVQKEIKRIMHFWLKLGVAGFRMDAVPHMVRQKKEGQFEGDPHQFLRDLREFVEDQRPDALLLAEVDTEPEKYKNFFGNSDQMHMLLNFYLDNYLFLSFARKNARPIKDALKNLPQTLKGQQYATFLRNHDELDLERLTDEEREEVFKEFAPEEGMRIFGRGIRRRLPPMLQNNRQRLELAYSLLFSLPGTPVLRYGQEIGMGEDLSLPGRNSVRTPMQWSEKHNGGFSSVPAGQLVRPVISGGEFGYEKVNVNQQRREKNSLLAWVEKVIRLRKDCPSFGWGDVEVIESDDKVLIHCCRWEDQLAVAVHNLSDKPCSFRLGLPEEEASQLVELLSNTEYEAFDPSAGELSLTGFGYRWFQKNVL